MILPRNLIPLLLIFSALLLSSTTSALLCPNIPPSDSVPKQYVIYSNPPGLIGGLLGNLLEVLDLLICLKREIIPLGFGVFDKLNGNVVIDLSYKGKPDCIYTGSFNDEEVKALREKSNVKFVEEIRNVKADSVIPPSIFKRSLRKRTTQTSAPYNLDRIDQTTFPLDGSYTYPDSAGSGVNVYVVDTGIFVTNVEFEGRASHGGTFCSNCTSTDDHGHGTNVAGIIGGKRFGVSKKSKLIAVKVLNQNGQGTSATVVAGLSYVITQHKNSSNKNTIVNLSLSSAVSSSIDQLVSDCADAGIHVVVSAGDKGLDACDFSPSTSPQAISVGATEKTSNSVASFSNTGDCVDLYAPGRNITAAGAGDNNALSQASGTSQSCPHAAGTVALIISKMGNRSPSSMKTTIVSLTSQNILTNAGGDPANPNAILRVPAQ